MSDLKKELGSRIKKIRKEKNITQKELAEMVGCAEITIRQYENGRYSPKIDTRIAIAKALDIPYDCLFNPFAQLGTNLAEVGTDLISRQGTIDALRRKA